MRIAGQFKIESGIEQIEAGRVRQTCRSQVLLRCPAGQRGEERAFRDRADRVVEPSDHSWTGLFHHVVYLQWNYTIVPNTQRIRLVGTWRRCGIPQLYQLPSP